jgi:hypothetical protein
MPISRFWLVEVHEDLEHLPMTPDTSPTTLKGVWISVRHVNGVKRVWDCKAISQETLDLILYKPPPTQPRGKRNGRGRS